MSDAVYSTKVSATGGRHGSIRSEDGLFNLKLALPRTLGGKGDATNPERFFAGGYASSFQNALFHVSREARRHFADCDIEVVAQIGLMKRSYKGITGRIHDHAGGVHAIASSRSIEATRGGGPVVLIVRATHVKIARLLSQRPVQLRVESPLKEKSSWR
jgi:Ohr subfamily peroxiredoxin